jgi:ribosomal protein L37AE/L43A
MNVDDLEVTEDEYECPTCKKTGKQRVIERVPRQLHIPPRYALICQFCKTPWYRRREEDENEVQEKG